MIRNGDLGESTVYDKITTTIDKIYEHNKKRKES